MARKNELGSRKNVKAASLTAVYPGVDRNAMDFRQTLINSGTNEVLNAKSSGFWKGGSLPEHLPNWQIPSAPALLLQSHNPPADWRGPDFMDTMNAIYHNSSLNAIRYLQKSGILTPSNDKGETNNS